ncbi:hypothetical protein WJX81_003260 [Elliptochloris bilobata]|uniref:Nuclear pore complex protein Nup205 n=1 Tax=Elliptochloris bilobata TaxID=381761 RepID=A0AAW1RWJ2_9CHLO
MDTTAVGSSRSLFNFVLDVTEQVTDVEPAAVIERLQQYRPTFLNLLKSQGPNAQSRREVESLHPATAEGRLRLDPADAHEALLLADELQLDELIALACLEAAHTERGEATAEVAAGLWLEERRALVGALHRLLQAQALPSPDVPPALAAALAAFNANLLGQRAGGRSVLLGRLIDLIKAAGQDVGPGTRLAMVVDDLGRQVDRRGLAARERTLLCECLVYALRVQQRVLPADVGALVDLLHSLALRTRGTGVGDMAAMHHAGVVLVGLLPALLPCDAAEEAGQAEDGALGALAESRALGAKLEGAALPEDGFHAVARLAWGLLLSQHAPPTARERAATCVRQACEAGALRFLEARVLRSVPFEDEPPAQQELYAQTLHQLLMLFLDVQPGRDEVGVLASESSALSRERAETAGTLVAAGATRDALDSLLDALAAVYDVFPDLWLDERLRDNILGGFMEYVALSPVMRESSSVFVAYLGILTSLAQGEDGAQAMFLQLRQGDASEQVSWSRMFQVMKQYCARYAPPQEPQIAGNGAATEVGAGGAAIVPEADAAGMVAYLRLFARVMAGGAPGAVAGWVRALEEEVGVAPLWEVLFQLMCHPVPQKLKAALDDAIAAFARRPEAAAALWERLLAAVVVAPGLGGGGSGGGGGGGGRGLPRYDLTYQLNEVEARAEDFAEALAFVRLLNALLRASGSALPDGGRPYAHFTAFVLVEILGSLHQRAFQSQRQKWELAAAALEHLGLALAYSPPPSAAAPANGQEAPGTAVMLDLLGEREAARAAWGLLAGGVDALMLERRDAGWGAAKEAAVLAALRLLRLAFERDIACVAALRRSPQAVGYETLDGPLRRNRRRLVALIDYVRYEVNPAVQAEAVRVTRALAERLPALLDMLLPPTAPGEPPAYQRIRGGFAAMLEEAVAGRGAYEAEAGEDGEPGDERGGLVLALMQAAADAPAPNLAHALAGYDVQAGPGGLAASVLDPRRVHSCLAPLLAGFASGALAAQRPGLYEGALALLHRLAAAPESGPPLLELLRHEHLVADQLEAVAAAALPPEGPERATALHQRALLLQLAALEMHTADAALPVQRMALEELLATLLLPHDASAEGDRRGGCMAGLLEAAAYPIDQPQLSHEAGPDVSRLQQRMGIDALLGSQATVEQGGVRAVSARGDLCYHIPVLTHALRQRYNEAEADPRRFPSGLGAAGSDELREACRAALRFAQRANAAAEQSGGQAALVAAWQAAAEVAFTRRQAALDAASGGCAEEAALQALGAVAGVLVRILPTEAARLAPPLAKVARSLAARLRERAAGQLPGAAGVGAALRLPASARSVLGALLRVLGAGRSTEAVRVPLYGALLAVLAGMRAPALTRAPPAVLAALLAGGGEDAAALEARQAEVDAGAAALLRGAAWLVEDAAADALRPGGHPVARAQALALLAALVEADDGAATADALQAGGLPARLLADLAAGPQRDLLRPGPAAAAALVVAEAQLGLLQALVLSGEVAGGEAAAHRLAAAGYAERLAACGALDLTPEEPAGGVAGGAASSLRVRLGRLAGAALRVVGAALAGRPGSPQAREDLAGALDERARLLAALANGSSGGGGGWFERGALAAAAADAERDVDALQYAAENGLTTLFLHLWQRPVEELGSPQDMEQLRRTLAPQLDQWERVSLPERDASALQLLARRTKAQLGSA